MRKKAIDSTAAVVYARYSAGPKQTDQSIEGQIYDCQEYAKKHGLTIIEYYIDRHISGKEDSNRSEFQRMLNDCCKGQFKYVITWKVDRFGRNREELAVNKSKLKRAGVQLVYAKESIPDGPEGIILESLLEGLAEYYSADLAQKVKRGMSESAKKGKVLGSSCIYGFQKSADGCYEINEPAAAIIREVFQRYADGDTVPQIIKDLNSRGVLTYKNKPFDSSTLYRALRNRKYIGECTFGDVVYESGIPQIIDNETFDRVQERMDANKHTGFKYAAPVPFLFTGKIICGECGESYCGESGTSKTGTVHRYYKCHGRKARKTLCNSPVFRKDWFEQFILQKTVTDVLNDDVIDYLVKEIIKVQESDSVSSEISVLKKEKREVEKSLSNIMRAIESGIFNDTTADRMSQLEHRSKELSVEISKAELKRLRLTPDHLYYWFDQFRGGDISDETFRKHLADAFINQIFVYEDRVVIAYNCANNNPRSIDLSELSACVRTRSRKVDLMQPCSNFYILSDMFVVDIIFVS